MIVRGRRVWNIIVVIYKCPLITNERQLKFDTADARAHWTKLVANHSLTSKEELKPLHHIMRLFQKAMIILHSANLVDIAVLITRILHHTFLYIS